MSPSRTGKPLPEETLVPEPKAAGDPCRGNIAHRRTPLDAGKLQPVFGECEVHDRAGCLGQVAVPACRPGQPVTDLGVPGLGHAVQADQPDQPFVVADRPGQFGSRIPSCGGVGHELQAYLAEVPRGEDFGNARFARQLLDTMFTDRLAAVEASTLEELKALLPEDLDVQRVV